VLLRNEGGLLPIAPGRKVFLRGIDPASARRHGLIPVEDPARADVALIRAATPFETLHPNHFFGGRQHEGRLDFRDGDPDYEAIRSAAARVPVIVSIFLDRPAILTNVRDKSRAILGNFGASDDAVLDVVTGRVRAKGRLPFDLPSSMAAVDAQDPALPDDSRTPLYPFGAGIVDERR
jgi:beta-glucosidase